jgi:poly-gamma-glutamate capsule biosynthesis protein CapA/YwtB (metallophosphatase superfamily)
LRLALAGDTMLGRRVGEAIDAPLFAPEVVAAAAEADLFVVNLECCISARGAPWPDPGKPFFFRAPPAAAERLAEIGVDCVTLANNHALDYGAEALLDTFEHLTEVGIPWVGAGVDEAAAQAARVVHVGEERLAVVAFADHPAAFAAGPSEPGIAYASLRDCERGAWPADAVALAARAADVVLVSPHWGPNMTAGPSPPIRRVAELLLAQGATLVAGHSAHVFHGVAPGVLYDLGDFIDDYVVHERLRNDLGLLFLVDVDAGGPRRIEAVPLKLDYCHTGLAVGEDAAWIRRRFIAACAELGTEAFAEGDRLIVAARA